jgi:quinol monooxygenase YgiN
MSFYTTVRGKLKVADPQAALELHNAIVGGLRPRNEPLGGVGHRVFANVQDPMEFLALDTWDSMEGLQQAFGDPDTQAQMGSMFDGPPEVTIWAPREGWTAF